MAEHDLKAEVRDKTGKQPAKSFRKQGYVPGVMYGHGEPAIPIAIEEKTLSHLLEKTHGDNVIFNLKIEGHDEAKAVLKEVQRDAVTREVVHVDFQHIHVGEALTVQIPIILKGSSPGIKEGGILEHILRSVEVRCLPSQIPDHFEVDISNLGLGDSLHVKDIDAGPVRILDDEETPTVSIVVPRAKVEVAPVVAEEVAPEEAEAEKVEEEEGEKKEEKKEVQKES